jgi:hypothetical protein
MYEKERLIYYKNWFLKLWRLEIPKSAGQLGRLKTP